MAHIFWPPKVTSPWTWRHVGIRSFNRIYTSRWYADYAGFRLTGDITWYNIQVWHSPSNLIYNHVSVISYDRYMIRNDVWWWMSSLEEDLPWLIQTIWCCPPIFVVKWLVLEWSLDQQDYLWRCSEVIPQSMVVPITINPGLDREKTAAEAARFEEKSCSESESSSIASHGPNDFSSGSHLWY